MIRNSGNFVEAYYYYENNNISTYSTSTIDSDDQTERRRMNSSPTLAAISGQYPLSYLQISEIQAKNALDSSASNYYNQQINISSLNNNCVNFTQNEIRNNNLQQSLKLDEGNDGQKSPDSNNGKKQTDQTKYKTELCNTFTITGHCDYGAKCRFAHGKDELQKKPSITNNNFRTKYCKAFHEKMYCPYGQRCHFLHDVRSLIQIQSKKVYQKKLILDQSLMQKNTNQKLTSRLPIFNYICSSNNQFSCSTSK
ncbi:zinc finger C-x8-C-x5-C-x3-H type protein (macronuclear) [Tetrahymena thermophila SB210]|uniref:Zinc finger C-x8-C-x5-C-x3-H type protein n=1 Tax=Tetrahymena thermophila (strain SB210) TaxID=312017 RepID=I7MDZ6_TETTS|nr:zinc finger C-x8-C-x5-C-x3-H type protein [Tetrahymena thermophila SB210]EAR93739.1 zinc finger C-x8-C-x5-C-x3-H type protein [Tetrahymena thermophila SB210]|eukprot:XP_001013984.1 zinc finger C-x8-C-x5-C-x3-H type protein [Tetrahymena thermophila SB210]